MNFQTETISDLVLKNFGARKEYIQSNKLEAYRLITAYDTYFLFAVDIYLDNAVIQLFGELKKDVIDKLEATLRAQLGIKDFFYKNHTKNAFALPEAGEKEIIITEYGHRFHINLSDYLDTGLFLDHRGTRRWIAARSKDKVVLNTFAYTGSFTVYAASGGAKKTHSVDLSRTYCEWIKKNLALNNLSAEQNWIYKMDTFEFFKYARKKKLHFDIIIIDPPTFSRNKGNAFSVKNEHPRLINEALALLSPGGFILFSTNYQDFGMNRRGLLPCNIEEKHDLQALDFGGSFTSFCYVISRR